MSENINQTLKNAHKHGLYDPNFEHDSCGVGFVVNAKGQPSHQIVKWALEICVNLDHRGARGADPKSGDGSGLFMQIPHKFFSKKAKELDFQLPKFGEYGVGFLFLSPYDEIVQEETKIIENIFQQSDIQILGWRDVPVNNSILGKESSESEPLMKQIFVKKPKNTSDIEFERTLYIIRRISSLKIKEKNKNNNNNFFYFSSLSAKTITYKGMLATDQLEPYFPDFYDTDFESAMALTHSRFSTNTFPSWHRAQPFRYIAHNGEINTLRGNINWMRARQKLLKSKTFGQNLEKILPILQKGGSDSQNFDNCLEFLYLSGYSLPHAMMMMIPEPWEKHQSMNKLKSDFYQYHACLMEPWDGPASMAFSDGEVIGAVLDRNGLRPSRYYVTKDDLVIMASEVGVIPEIDPKRIIKKGRLEPGKMFLVDTKQGRIIDDEEIKQQIASEKPYGKWIEKNIIHEKKLQKNNTKLNQNNHTDNTQILEKHKTFGYTYEDLRFIITPSAENGLQPLGSMGNDTPLAVFSHKPILLFNYFKQLFAQVSNPAIDPIREEIVTSSITFIGSEGDIINPTEKNCRLIKLESPLIDNQKLSDIFNYKSKHLKSKKISLLFDTDKEELQRTKNKKELIKNKNKLGKKLKKSLKKLFSDTDKAIENGYNLIILSDRKTTQNHIPIPSLLAVSGLHHHLIKKGTRTKISIILESGEPREVHHFALLLGYGCDVINPYLALDTVNYLKEKGDIKTSSEKAKNNFLKANLKGVIKTMAKIGISTVASYRGAQIFEAIGLNSEFIKKYFTNTPSRIEGIGIEEIAIETTLRHAKAHSLIDKLSDELDPGGTYQWRKDGERHLFSPIALHKLQISSRLNDKNIYKEYAKEINDQARKTFTLRGLMEFDINKSKSIPIEEVEPIKNIVKRFKTGAMSYGSISKEAHETLAIAMNRLGGKSNTGEGGENPERFTRDENGDLRRSAIKQVASGRFGVTSYYLANSDEIQIKIVQGAKPGEGGELPGHKVFPEIAKIRGTTPGVGLISPPPHHDIYSIEDLAELIHDLKNSNPRSNINVKLVSSVGVGTIASGVAKGKADVILISGFDGGTGASPLSSIYHAGSPWELGLAEANQTLLLNNLRSRVKLEVDGQLKTGRDVAIACLLGAEEFGFATAPLVTIGCLMMRVCHKNTCPVGIATQNKKLREKFNGKADYVVNFLTFIAEELREIMADLGFRTINEMIGRSDRLHMKNSINYYKSLGLDYSRIFYSPKIDKSVGRYSQIKQDHHIDESLDRTNILHECKPALENGKKVELNMDILNTNRVVGTILGYEISKKFGINGLPDDTIKLNFKGSAGQSLGAFLPKGVTITIEGDTNDYCGKGLGQGKIIVYPPKGSQFEASENTIVGNVSFYGATGGEAYISGIAGERFCVRNSGVKTVVEGLGDHGCEYMTGGIVICLGKTGRNFGAGMSGGEAYILDEDGDFLDKKLNHQMVNIYHLNELQEDEIHRVKNMIKKHIKYTNSKKGKYVLDNFNSLKEKFIKVFPSDYQRVLEAQQKARDEGLKGDEAIQFAFEENVKTGN